MASEKFDDAVLSKADAEGLETSDDTTIYVKGDDEAKDSSLQPGASDEKASDAKVADPIDQAAENSDPEQAAGATTPPIVKPMLGVKTDEDGDDIVGWNGPDDPENPYNWPSWSKVTHCGVISALTFLTPLASCKWPPYLHITALSPDRCPQQCWPRLFPSSCGNSTVKARRWPPSSSLVRRPLPPSSLPRS